MRKTFTLIELLVVTVVLALLAGIIIPNVQHVKEKSLAAALSANLRSLQTAIDVYSVQNDSQLPTTEQPTEFIPVLLDLKKLSPTYIRKVSSIQGAKYWLDYNGTVWGSTIDAPMNMKNVNGVITWSAVDKAKEYRVFEVKKVSLAKSAVAKKDITFSYLTTVTNSTYTGEKGKDYVVSAVNEKGLETVPTGVGYFQQNTPPVAVITYTPHTNLLTNTEINWTYDQSYDLDNDLITEAEWQGKQSVYETEGNYEVKLRVKDSHGLWSDWATTTISVQQANHKPVPTIVFTPSTITTLTDVSFTYTAIDLDGDTIINKEWKIDTGNATSASPNGRFTEGTHTISLRVQDSKGLWSDWVSSTFNVSYVSQEATKIMTADTSNGITVSANYYCCGYQPFKAFDHSTSTYDMWETGYQAMPSGGHWLKIDFGAVKMITSIKLNPGYVRTGQYGVKKFILYGSNDNTNFTSIYTGTHDNSDTEQTYSFTNSTAYRYYRINVVETYSSDGYTAAILELHMFE